MKRYFFLGFGVGFILAGIIATIYVDTGNKSEKKALKTEQLYPHEIETKRIEETFTEINSDKNLYTVEEQKPDIKIVPETDIKKESIPEVEIRKEETIKEKTKIEVKETALKKEVAKTIEKPIVKKEPVVEKKTVKKDIAVQNKANKGNDKTEPVKVEKTKTEPIKEDATAPLSPTGERLVVSKPPLIIKEKIAEPENEKEVQEIKVKNYYVRVITTTSMEECERLVARVKEINLSYGKSGNKYTVVSANCTKEEGEGILKKLEKYNLKGLLVKKSK